MNPSAQFTAVMRAPLVRVIDEQSVTFPLLTAAELGELGEVIRAEWWEAAQKNPQAKAFTPVQMFRVRQELDEAIIPITEIVKRVVTMSGAAWCVGRSLTKGGYDDAQRAAILESLAPFDLRDLSELVSRIRFLPKQTAKPDAGDNVNRPLPVGGEQPTPAPTGEQSPSNSPSSESTQAA